jgi:SMC interacting uncharacterized protein involved in chromosome segregation
MKVKDNSQSVHDNSDSKDYQNIKNVLSKFDYDLFNEEEDVVEKVVRVKRVSLPNKGERWKILQDNKAVFIIDGSKISKKEREYLRSIDGFNFLITQAKAGIKSLNKLRIELKKNIK